MSVITKTWTWDASTESWALTAGSDSTFVRDTTQGSPNNGSLKHVTSGRNKAGTSTADLTATWENLGVPAGSVINTVRISDVRCYAGLSNWNVVDTWSFAFTIKSGGTDVTGATIWSRSGSSQDGSWQTGSSTAQAVNSSYQASTTSLALQIAIAADLGNNSSAACSGHLDYLNVEIDYSPAPSTISPSSIASSEAFGSATVVLGEPPTEPLTIAPTGISAPGGTGGSPTRVQELGTASTTSTAVNPLVVSPTSKTVTVGNHIIVFMGRYTQDDDGEAFTDNLGNTYNRVEFYEGLISNSYLSIFLYIAEVTTGGSLTSITCTWPTTKNYTSIIAEEWANLDLSTDSSGGSASSSSTLTTGQWTNPSGITIPANGAVIGALEPNNPSTTVEPGSASGTPSTTIYEGIGAIAPADPTLVLFYALAGSSEVTGFIGSATWLTGSWFTGGSRIFPAGVGSAFGTATVSIDATEQTITPTAIDSAEAFGSHTVSTPGSSYTITPTAIASAETVSNLIVGNGLQYLIDIASPSDTLNVTGQIFIGKATVNKALTIVGGTLYHPAVASATAALTLSANSIVIDGMTIDGQAQDPAYFRDGHFGIYSATAGLTGIEIKNCHFKNFRNGAIWLSDVGAGVYGVVDPWIHHNIIENCAYTGIMLLSVDGGTVEHNDIFNLGIEHAVTFTDAGDLITCNGHELGTTDQVQFSSIVTTTGISTYTAYWVVNPTANTFQISDTYLGSPKALTGDGTGKLAGGIGDNVYGIAPTNTTGRNRSRDLLVRYNRLSDIPRWHAIDTHGGVDCIYEYNTTHRVRRPFFLTSSDVNALRNIVRYNYVYGTDGRTDYPDKIAVTVVYSTDSYVINNVFSSDYPVMGQFTDSPGNNRVYDYLLGSTNLVVQNNYLLGTVVPPAITSAEAFGTASISIGTSPKTIEPSAIASSEAIGTATLLRGGVSVQPTGIATAEAFGTATISRGTRTLVVTGIATAESVSSPTLLKGTARVIPTGITAGEVFGTATLLRGGRTLVVTGIASAEAFGTASVVSGGAPAQTITTTAIDSAEFLGTATLLRGGVKVLPTGITSTEAVGSPAIRASAKILPAAIASAQALGNPVLTVGGVAIQPSAITSAEAFGNLYFAAGQLLIAPVGLASAVAFGTAVVRPGGRTISVTAITTAQALGTPVLAKIATILPSGIASAGAYGVPVVIRGAVSIVPQGATTGEALGTPTIVMGGGFVLPTPIGSGEAFGNATVSIAAAPSQSVEPTAIDTGTVFGVANLRTGNVNVLVSGIGTAAVVPNPALYSYWEILPTSITAAELLGLPVVAKGPAYIRPNGIESGEVVPSAALANLLDSWRWVNNSPAMTGTRTGGWPVIQSGLYDTTRQEGEG